MNLFLALYEEHKSRTGHDIYRIHNLSNFWNYCNVCLYLHAEKRNFERLEEEHFQRLDKENYEK